MKTCHLSPTHPHWHSYINFAAEPLAYTYSLFSHQVTYLSRFIHTDSYTKNQAANRIVLSSFGTIAHRDPCKTLYDKYEINNLVQHCGIFSDLVMEILQPCTKQTRCFTILVILNETPTELTTWI